MSPLALLAGALVAGASPFVAEQPQVRQGNEKLLSGDAAGALERYDAAEREAGPRPEIDFDRGGALHALGRHAEAREAWRRSLERDQQGPLSSRALQNMGHALDAEGDQEGALRSFAAALTRDPGNEDARYNLEVLLRRKASGEGKPEEEGREGRGKPGGEPEQGRAQPSKPEPKQGAEGQKAGPAQRPGEKPGQDREEEPGSAGDQERREQAKQDQAGAADRAAGLDRQGAERLLDALRARERNMPLGPAGRKEPRRRDAGKDW